MNADEKTDIKALIERVIEYRTIYGLSQHKFAERAGLSKGFISKLEEGRCVAPKPMSVRQIEYVLNGGIVKKENISGKNMHVCPLCGGKLEE